MIKMRAIHGFSGHSIQNAFDAGNSLRPGAGCSFQPNDQCRTILYSFW